MNQIYQPASNRIIFTPAQQQARALVLTLNNECQLFNFSNLSLRKVNPLLFITLDLIIAKWKQW